MRNRHYAILIPALLLSLAPPQGLGKDGERDLVERAARATETRSDSGSHGGSSGDSRNGDSRSGKDSSTSRDTVRTADTRSGSRNTERLQAEPDGRGGERRAGEVLFLGRSERLSELRGAGYPVISQRPPNAQGEVIARIRVRDRQDVDQAVAALQAAAPDALVGSNSLYLSAQGEPARAGTTLAAPMAGAGTDTRIGMIDTGASGERPALASRLRVTRGFEGGYEPREHGTRVAELLASSGATLYAADVFGLDQKGRVVASAEAITSALDWLSAEKLPVVNISIEGPRNVVIEAIVRRYVAMGGIVVAAAGNSGPRAAPAFPAAYPGVVAVTALDAQGHVYRRANQGDYISFAARGVDLPLGPKGERLSGTSYAAPLVAGEIARRLAASPQRGGREVVAQLQREAIDLGAKGRDPVFGWGRLDPSYAPWPGAALGSRP